MTTSSDALSVRLQEQRSRIVQGFLWTLLGIVAATMVLNAVLLGPLFLTVRALAPNLLFATTIGMALWLNARHRFGLAVGLVNVLVLGAASLPLLLVGLRGAEMSLILFFLPIVMAGLLMDRWALLVTSSWAAAVAIATPVLNGAQLLLGDPISRDPAWPLAIQFVIVLAAVTYFLDRFGSTFAATLRTSVERELALGRAAQSSLQAKERLIEEKRFTDAIVENLPGIFYVLGENGSYFKWNRNFAHVLGYTEEELAGLHPVDLFEGEERSLVARRIEQVFASGHASVEASVVTKDGRRVPYVLNGTRVTLGGATYLAGIGIDRSEIDAARERIRTLNAELVERLERITALHEIDKAITGSTDLNLTLTVVLEQVRNRLQVDAAAVLLFKPSTMTLRFGEGLGFRGTTIRGTELRLGEGLAGRAAAERARVVVTDPEALRASYARTAVVEDEGFVAYVAVPLVAKGQLQGVLELYHRSAFEPTDEWTAFLATLATQTAIALDNTMLVENLERSNVDLRLAYDTTIEGWARALDLRDEETEGHSRRVTDLTVELAERIGIPDADLPHIRRGALLHDIGKMGIPDAILLKPGKLDAEEWTLMKRHTSYARELLAPIPFLRDALDIPYAHHERWDGSGYPRGLAGEQIPLAARLFAVVDVYDALTSDRPYRPAWSEEEALAHIRDQAGTHFDPHVVDAFLQLVHERHAAR